MAASANKRYIKPNNKLQKKQINLLDPLLHNDMDRYRDLIIGDIEWCRQNKIDYVPCVTPGFSWHNLSRFEFPDDIRLLRVDTASGRAFLLATDIHGY